MTGKLSFVPAHLGTFIISDSRLFGRDSAQSRKRSVIAWAVDEAEKTVFPVTMEGVQDDECFVMMPDGHVETIDEYWPSFENWVND
jgi:hypothetical protein